MHFCLTNLGIYLGYFKMNFIQARKRGRGTHAPPPTHKFLKKEKRRKKKEKRGEKGRKREEKKECKEREKKREKKEEKERKLEYSPFRERRGKEGSGKVSWDATIDCVAEAPNDVGGSYMDIPLSFIYAALIWEWWQFDPKSIISFYSSHFYWTVSSMFCIR